MTNAQIALSRRAVTCRSWRWMPGTSYAWSRSATAWIGAQDRVADKEQGTLRTDGSLLPDLTDAATLGCLLALVREVWGCVVITSPEYDYDYDEARQGPHVIGWRAVETVRWTPVGEGATEAGALVAALDAALSATG